jgi:uncharacterized damage-inducible protein DinB
MSEIARIQDQLKRSHRGKAWHGPALDEVLKDVSADKAAAKPIPNAHSIWELVLHVIAWERFVARRLAGEAIVEVPENENFPTPRSGEQDWQQTKTDLEAAHQQLREAIGRLTDANLDDIVSGLKYSVYFMLHGVIQHNLYHAGQIAILKKAQ